MVTGGLHYFAIILTPVVWCRLVGSFYVYGVSPDLCKKFHLEAIWNQDMKPRYVSFKSNPAVLFIPLPLNPSIYFTWCHSNLHLFTWCHSNLHLFQANRKNGMTVTWSKFPSIEDASGPQWKLVKSWSMDCEYMFVGFFHSWAHACDVWFILSYSFRSSNWLLKTSPYRW